MNWKIDEGAVRDLHRFCRWLRVKLIYPYSFFDVFEVMCTCVSEIFIKFVVDLCIHRTRNCNAIWFSDFL